MTNQIETVIADGEYYGMQSFDQHLMKLFGEGTIAVDEALANATSPHDFNVLIRQAGLG
jgi:twitching motility protein PilT